MKKTYTINATTTSEGLVIERINTGFSNNELIQIHLDALKTIAEHDAGEPIIIATVHKNNIEVSTSTKSFTALQEGSSNFEVIETLDEEE